MQLRTTPIESAYNKLTNLREEIEDQLKPVLFVGGGNITCPRIMVYAKLSDSFK